MSFDQIGERAVLKKRVLHVIPSLNKSLGGTVECVRQMSAGVIDLGYDVEILTLDDEVDSRPNFGAKVISAGPRHIKYAFSIRLLWWLLRHIRNYDSVIVNGVWQFHAVAVFVAASINRIPFLIYPHGMITEYCVSNNPIKRLKKIIYWSLVERWVLTGASAVLCTSIAEMVASKGYLPGSSKIRFEVIGNGIELPSFDSNDELSEIVLAKYNLRRHKYLIYLGRIDKIKGIDTLLHVYAGNEALRDSYQLVIAGPLGNECAEELINLTRQLNISPGLHWIGSIHGEEKWRLLACASALVLLSHHENFSIVVAEALAVGTPVLTTNKVGTSGEILQYNAGFVGDDTIDGAKQILNKWISLCEHDKSIMKRNAQLCFDESFRIELPAQRLVRILEENLPN